VADFPGNPVFIFCHEAAVGEAGCAIEETAAGYVLVEKPKEAACGKMVAELLQCPAADKRIG
jgi:hypothetical protein